jgi:putative spermidine/putrescine transport system ATP-binding protein
VVDAAAGRLSLDGQEVRTVGAIGGLEGAREVSLALRPEGMSLGDGPDDANRLRGIVDDVSFLGSVVRIRMRLGADGQSISIDTFNEPHIRPPQVGESVTAWFAREATLVLGQAAAPGTSDPIDEA